jgi:aminomethyltransferase
MAMHTPLYDWHVARRGRMVEFGGWMLPVQYTTLTDEHVAVRTAAGLFDISHMGRLTLTGGGALGLIQHAYTNNAATMKEGQARYGLVCNQSGGIRDDVLVYRWATTWGMVVNASNRAKVVEHLRGLMAGRDVSLEDQTESTAMLALQGPRALALSEGMFDPSPASLKYYFATPAKYRGEDCIVSRTGYTGEDGFEVMARAGLGAALADDFIARGAKPCGLGARDTLRLEAAMPLYGHELTEETDPLQAGLGWAVKLDKGDFVGREAILRRQQDATRPVRVGLALEGKRAAREGAEVRFGGQPAGKVTSGTLTPTLGKAIAMAYVAPQASAPGAEVEVALPGGASTTARVVPLPFYRRP